MSFLSIDKRHRTVGVKVGPVTVGGGAPVVVQSMTMTDTADARATAAQCVELAEAGSEMVRVTVNTVEAATAVPEIKQRMLDAGCTAPLIGDFHYNGHQLLTRFPECAAALDKYRINPGNVGTGRRRDEQFTTICQVAVDHQLEVTCADHELVEPRAEERGDLAAEDRNPTHMQQGPGARIRKRTKPGRAASSQDDSLHRTLAALQRLCA